MTTQMQLILLILFAEVFLVSFLQPINVQGKWTLLTDEFNDPVIMPFPELLMESMRQMEERVEQDLVFVAKSIPTGRDGCQANS